MACRTVGLAHRRPGWGHLLKLFVESPSFRHNIASAMTSFAEITDRTTEDELRARGSLKWSKGGPGVIGAFVAEMDFGVAPPIEAALLDVIGRADLGYVSGRAGAEMASACATWQRERYGWDIDPERVRPLPDVITGLAAAITLFSRPGSPVILPTPAYMPFLTVPGSLGRDIIQVPMVIDGGRYVLDLDGIDAAFKRGGHLLVLCNPCNPVGRVYDAGELTAVAEVVEANGGRVFADEITRRSSTPAARTFPTPHSAPRPPRTP